FYNLTSPPCSRISSDHRSMYFSTSFLLKIHFLPIRIFGNWGSLRNSFSIVGHERFNTLHNCLLSIRKVSISNSARCFLTSTKYTSFKLSSFKASFTRCFSSTIYHLPSPVLGLVVQLQS